ncbi:MAG: radical SAM protein [Butyricicoccus sp.]
MIRYSVIPDKNPREIVMLRGTGCRWKRCTFCDYHLDRSDDTAANFALNREVLSGVTGLHHHLEVINSGSFSDLDPATLDEIERVCREKDIHILHFECHWMHRQDVPALRARFAAAGVTVKVKTGVETFDRDFRENVLHKGIGESDPAKIAEPFDECCLLFGLTGQTGDSMRRDIETGLRYFERVCVNLMTPNTTPIQPDRAVLDTFLRTLYPVYKNDPRVDILLENTDFGVGEA